MARGGRKPVTFRSLSPTLSLYTTHATIETQCDANAESSLHRHSVSTADVIKAVKRLKTDKYNDDGIIMSNNFQHGTFLLYTRIVQLLSAMLYYVSHSK